MRKQASLDLYSIVQHLNHHTIQYKTKTSLLSIYKCYLSSVSALQLVSSSFGLRYGSRYHTDIDPSVGIMQGQGSRRGSKRPRCFWFVNTKLHKHVTEVHTLYTDQPWTSASTHMSENKHNIRKVCLCRPGT